MWSRSIVPLASCQGHSVVRLIKRLLVIMLVFVTGPAHSVEKNVSVRLYDGFNLFSYPVEVPANLSCANLQTQLGAVAVHRLDAATQAFETCDPPLTVFPIVPGEGYVVEMGTAGITDIDGTADCPSVNLPSGVNLIGVPSPEATLSCFELLERLGNQDVVATVQRFDADAGQFEFCGFVADEGGAPVGRDFGIVSGEGYLVSMRQALAGFDANDPSQCPAPCPTPVISGIDPLTATVGTRVNVTGLNLDCGGVPEVLIDGRAAVVVSRSSTAIEFVIPIGAEGGLVTVVTAGGTVIAPEEYALEVDLTRDFTLALAPSDGTVLQGSAASFRITASGSEGFADLIALNAEGLPEGLSAQFNPATITAGQSTTLFIEATDSAVEATTAFTINGSTSIDGFDVTRQASASVTVVAGGRTALIGQFMMEDGTPLPGVSLTLDGQTTATDDAGNFQFVDVAAGKLTLSVDARPANSLLPTYGVDIELTAGEALRLPPFRFHSPPPPEQFVPFDNATQDQAITNPKYPGAAFILPAGVTIVGWDGTPKTQLTLERLDPDRLPVLPPPGPTRSVYQPFWGTSSGGIPSDTVPVTLPNDLDLNPGDKAEFWYYDAAPIPGEPGEWKLGGLGTVSEDGSTIATDAGVGINRFCGVCGLSCFIPVQESQPNNNRCGPSGGDPVNLGMGQWITDEIDLEIPGRIPATIQRTYNPFEPFGAIAGFELGLGPGWALSVDAVVQAETNTLRRLILPGNSRFAFTKKPDGTFSNNTFPSFAGAVLTDEFGGAHTLRWKDGTIWRFTPTSILGLEDLTLLVAQIDRNGNRLTIERDSHGQIQRIVEPAGRALVFTHANNRISEIRDPIGRTVNYGYDSAKRLETVTNPEGGVTRYTYDSQGRVLTVTNPRQITFLTNEYDSAGRVKRQFHADGAEWTFDYFRPCRPDELIGSGTATATAQTCPIQSVDDGPPTLIVETDPNGDKMTRRISATGFQSESLDALGQRTVFERDVNGQVLAMTDPLGRNTRFEYDDAENVIKSTDAKLNVRRFEYESVFNQLTKVIDPLENETEFGYDSRGNLVSITDPLGNATLIGYNRYGDLVAITDPLQNVTTFDYDHQGNLVAITDPLGNTTTLVYDFVSRLIAQIDPRGMTTRFYYDQLNRLIQTVDALGRATSFSYDANDNLLSVKDARQSVTSYTYDIMDRLESRTDPLNATEHFEYDGLGNLIQHTDRKEQITTFTYDPLGRRTESRYADATVHFVYDAVGRQIEVQDSLGSPILNEYDELDQLVEQTSAQGTIRYTYDALSRRNSMHVPGQDPVEYGYDASSRVRTISQGSAVVDFEYDALGRRTLLTLPNDVSTEYVYDAASRITNLVYRDSTTGVLGDLSYIHDAAGNYIAMEGSFARTLLPDPVVSTSYDPANRQRQFGSIAMDFDDNGNLISKADSNDVTTYTWDTRNRLTSLNDSSLFATFTYDSKNRRISKHINSQSVDYVYDGLDVIQEWIDGESINSLRSRRIDELLMRDGEEFFIADVLSSTVAVIDNNGIIITDYNYEPFGRTDVSGNSGNAFQFTGRENDRLTNLYYYRARYYDPQAKRFISEDPLGLAFRDTNLFRYVFNRPVNLVDPYGEFGVEVVITIVIIGGTTYFVWRVVNAAIPPIREAFCEIGRGDIKTLPRRIDEVIHPIPRDILEPIMSPPVPGWPFWGQ